MSEAAASPANEGRDGFRPAVIVTLLLVGLAAFVAFFAASAYDEGIPAEKDGGAHALSKSAVGYAGAVDLLRKTGRPTVVARGPVSAENAWRSVMVATPPAFAVTESVFESPVVDRFDGAVLVVLPKWAVGLGDRVGWVEKRGVRRVRADVLLKLPQSGRPVSLEEADATEEEAVGPSAPMSFDEAVEAEAEQKRRRDLGETPALKTGRAAAGAARTGVQLDHAEGRSVHTLAYVGGKDEGVRPSIRTGTIDRLQTFSAAPGWVPVIVDEDGRPVLITGETWAAYYVLSDPDLMNTHGIAELQNARALVFMLDNVFGKDTPLVFDVTLNGYQRSRSFLRQAFEPPFLAATLCTLAAILLMGWHAFFRFGAARREGREFALGKRALADNQAELFRMTGREHRLGGRYGTMVRDLAARAVGAPRDMTPEQLDEFLDRLGEGGRTSWPLSTLRNDIEQAKDAQELARAAGRLHHWRLEMTLERK